MGRRLPSAARVIVLVALAVGLAGPAIGVAQSTPTPAAASKARLFSLPGAEVFPDGIGFDQAHNAFYVGSAGDGTIFRGDRASGTVSVLTPGAGHTPVGGLRADDQGRLLVAGLQSGTVFVYNAATGKLLASFHTRRSANTYLSDLAVAPNGDVWVTDALSPMLFKIPAAALPQPGKAPASPVASDAANLNVGIDLTGTSFPMGPGFNANGIVVTPDGQYALLAHAASGTLYRVDLAQRSVARIDLGGTDLHGSSGLALNGHTLYVVHQGVVSPVEMNLDFRRGSVGQPISDPSFSSPTRIALAGTCLLVVNSQFLNRDKKPTLPFTVSEVPIPGATAKPGTAAC